MNIKGFLDKHLEIVLIAGLAIVAVIAVAVGVMAGITSEGDAAPADSPSITYYCNGMPSQIPCSLMPSPFNTGTQIITVG